MRMWFWVGIRFEGGCLGWVGPLNPPMLGDFELGWVVGCGLGRSGTYYVYFE